MNSLPKISVCIPTYNNEQTIDYCLNYVQLQNYPRELIEIIIVDGGSVDNTKQICRKYTDIIIDNQDKVEEKGKFLGIKKANGEVIAFIDADNLLKDKELFIKMVQPFIHNENVIFSEPKFYSADCNDNFITRYISLIGGDDPVAVYLGIYDRYCYFKSDWTDSPYEIVDKQNDYQIYRLKDIANMPPFGANACFIKKNALLDIICDPFLHTDVVRRLLIKNNLFAKINVGISHQQDLCLINFLRKKIRRLTRNYADLKREYYFTINKDNAKKLIFKCLFILPLFIDSVIGYRNKKSWVWVLHPMMVLMTVTLYGYFLIIKKSWN